jgi:hypothetical protein
MGSRGTCLGLVLQHVSSALALVLCFITYKFGTMSGVKKKVDAENRPFQHNWTEDYYFILNKGLPVCLLCNESISVNKEYNLKRHFTSRHVDHQKIDGQLRKDEIQKLKKNLDTQQQMFNKQRTQNHSIIKASFVLSEKIEKHSKSFGEGECLVDVASMDVGWWQLS